MKKFYLILQLLFSSIWIYAQNNFTPAIAHMIYTEKSQINTSSIIGFYVSDKMFDINEEKFVLQKFDDVKSLNLYINKNTNYYVPCFEFQAEEKFSIKRIRSKKCKNRSMRFPSLVSAISWEKINDNTYILNTRTRYFQNQSIVREKAIYNLQKQENNTYFLEKVSILESISCP